MWMQLSGLLAADDGVMGVIQIVVVLAIIIVSVISSAVAKSKQQKQPPGTRRTPSPLEDGFWKQAEDAINKEGRGPAQPSQRQQRPTPPGVPRPTAAPPRPAVRNPREMRAATEQRQRAAAQPPRSRQVPRPVQVKQNRQGSKARPVARKPVRPADRPAIPEKRLAAGLPSELRELHGATAHESLPTARHELDRTGDHVGAPLPSETGAARAAPAGQGALRISFERDEIRRAIIYREILGPPRALDPYEQGQ